MHRGGSVDRDPVGAAPPPTHDTPGDGRGAAPPVVSDSSSLLQPSIHPIHNVSFPFSHFLREGEGGTNLLWV